MSMIIEEDVSDRVLEREEFSASSTSLNVRRRRIPINGVIIRIASSNDLPILRLNHLGMAVLSSTSELPVGEIKSPYQQMTLEIRRTLMLSFSTATNDPSEIVRDDAEEFLERVYAFTDAQDASDYVFQYFDDLLHARKYRLCHVILHLADETQLPAAVLRALLVTTAPVKEKVGSRHGFFKRAFARVVQEQGAAKADRLLGRLA